MNLRFCSLTGPSIARKPTYWYSLISSSSLSPCSLSHVIHQGGVLTLKMQEILLPSRLGKSRSGHSSARNHEAEVWPGLSFEAPVALHAGASKLSPGHTSMRTSCR